MPTYRLIPLAAMTDDEVLAVRNDTVVALSSPLLVRQRERISIESYLTAIEREIDRRDDLQWAAR